MTRRQSKEFSDFKRTVRSYYKKHKRDLPWRNTTNPYRILVSEVMLQQTQVDRVIPKYNEFLKKFGTPRSLAESTLREVLILWSGLGYNRRAKALHEAAKIIVLDHNGKVPQTKEELMELPGIGPYTAGAIRAFAYNKPEIFIETNIRTVFIHHFFKNKKKITDSDIILLIEKTLDTKNTREWHFALMDYGAMLKQKYPNPNRRSAHYSKQNVFKGSNRQLRGEIIKLLVKQRWTTKRDLSIKLEKAKEHIEQVLIDLVDERLITKKQKRIELL